MSETPTTSTFAVLKYDQRTMANFLAHLAEDVASNYFGGEVGITTEDGVMKLDIVLEVPVPEGAPFS